MTYEPWLMLGIMALVVFALANNRSPDVVLLGALVLSAAVGIVSPEEALMGFSNSGLLTVAGLFVVAAAMRETGALDSMGRLMLGRIRTERGVILRMAIWVPAISAFLNNTPIVAMFIPVLNQWCRNNSISPSRLLMPLSYLAILGGTCTLIGTSTNLVVNGMMVNAAEHAPELEQSLRPMGFFELGYVGLPYAIVGIVYLTFVGGRLLPQRKDFMERLEETSREYLVNMRIDAGCPLIGQQVEAAGLRHLTGLFLIEIYRDGRVISPVGPREELEEEDVLTFTGVVDSIVELERIPGLMPIADESYITEAAERRYQMLAEAVVSPASPLIGKTIRDANFRAMYNAAVVAVSRGGQRLKGRVGDIVLRAGDTLLLQVGSHFHDAHRNNPDFLLVSGVQESRAVRHEKAALSMGLLVLLVIFLAFGFFGDTAIAALLIAMVMIASRCISASQARQSLDWRTLITIAAALGLGKALVNSGLVGVVTDAVGGAIDGTGPWAPYLMLAAVYLLTAMITEMVTNNAAAALMFPFGVAMAVSLDVDPRPYAMAVTFAASAAFVTPLGYQTNLMVYGPGGYKFTDFVRVGLPLSLVLLVIATFLIPTVWPF